MSPIEGYTLEEVLAWVNAERKMFSVGPPLDYIPPGGMSACNCPIARALGNDNGSVMGPLVDPDEGWLPRYHDYETPYRPMPQCVRLFILDFDSGEYPELVDRSIV